MKYKTKFHCKQSWQTRIECSRKILIPNDWHCSVEFGALSFSVFVWQLVMCNWHFLLCPVPVNLFSSFGTGSSTKTAVPRNIFIFNFTLDTKPFKLLRCTCERTKAFAKFQLTSYETVLEISFSSSAWIIFQTPHVFPIGSSCMQHIRQGYHNPTARLWSGGIPVIQLVYYIRSTFCEVVKLFGAFLYHHQLFCHAVVWRSITQEHFSFLFDFVLTVENVRKMFFFSFSKCQVALKISLFWVSKNSDGIPFPPSFNVPTVTMPRSRRQFVDSIIV